MDKSNLKNISKCIGFGVIWAVLLFVIGIVITKFTTYTLKDVLFIEGLLFVFIGVLSSIGGNPMGVSLQGLGLTNSQYTSQANLEVSRMEKEKVFVKTTISMGLSTVALILGGVLTIILNFIL